jgi:Spx/MgsR family transcriptional regulator
MTLYLFETVIDMDVYTLKSCDTCRKAVKWLQAESITADIFDIRTDTISPATISAAINALGWEAVLNRRSTTWRNLGDADKQHMDPHKAASLITANPTLMKRPLFISNGNYIVGFDKNAKAAIRALSI